MPRLSHDAVVAHLEAQGLHFRSVTMQTEGEYLPTDVDWNNKDVPHLNQVHTWVDDVTFVVDRDLQASVSLQKVLGVPFPLVLVHYDLGPNHQAHVITLLAWTVVTHHEFVPLTATRTRAITTYTVGSNRFWMAFFPLIRWAIQRNYHRLMSEDVPMRERRGRLRAWGYTFRGDGEVRDIRDSVSIARDNVIAPAEPPPAIDPVPLASVAERRWALLGRTDHVGLKVWRDGSRLAVYPRMCPHEGADLDPVELGDGCLTCPWHGRRLAPIAELDLDAAEPRAQTPWHELAVVDHQLVVTLRR